MAGDCAARQHRAFAVAGGSFRRTIFHDLSLEWSAFGAHEFHPWGERAFHKQVFVCGVNKRWAKDLLLPFKMSLRHLL